MNAALGNRGQLVVAVVGSDSVNQLLVPFLLFYLLTYLIMFYISDSPINQLFYCCFIFVAFGVLGVACSIAATLAAATATLVTCVGFLSVLFFWLMLPSLVDCLGS